MRADVSGPQLIVDKRLVRLIKIPEIHHYRQVRQIARLHRLLHRYEVRLSPVRRLDSDHHIRVLPRHLRHYLRIHVELILVHRVILTQHPHADNVDQRQHTRLRRIDYPLPELREVAPAGRPRVHHGCDAGPKPRRVRLHTVIPVRQHPVLSPPEHMDVNIHQPWRDVQP